MKLIVGLGNPGPAYQGTRHNLGFRAIDRLAEKFGSGFNREKHKGLVAEIRCAGKKVMLLKPLTFMNLSGDSVALAARNNTEVPEDILVIYDEVELPLGRLRIRKKGSAGSHNGMKSVLQRLGTLDIPRLRLGVDGETRRGDLATYILGKFAPAEREPVEEMISVAAEAAVRCIEAGVDAAMNEFN